ncbi:MAG TPA: IS4 family transposase [Candidatus Saccharimonadales bacterium]|nr:IS4 family transposase [Candidatus Saccharimonadales bacterium]
MFEQILQQFPWQRFDPLARKHGLHRYHDFTPRKHFLALLGGILAGQQGLRSTTTALVPNNGALRLLGGKAPPPSTLSEANRNRPADLFVELFNELSIQATRQLRRDLRAAVRLIDATHLDLGKRMQRWLGLHQGKVAAKLHVVFDPSRQKPVFFDITPAKVNDITAAKDLIPIEPGATYVFDLGYYDFAWWAELAARGCSFVTRLKRNTLLREVEKRPVPEDGCVLSDQVGLLPERLSSTRQNPFRQRGREIEVRIDTGKVLRLFTNDLTSSAEEIAALYKERWQIELFFKWIKQNLRITRFMGTNENAIRTQIAVSLIAYLLVLLLRQNQSLAFPAARILLIARTHLFVRRPIAGMLDPGWKPPPRNVNISAQMSLQLCN